MTNIVKISNRDPQRLNSLEDRYDRLLAANQKKHYVYDDVKHDRYLACLLYIKGQIAIRRAENRKANTAISQALNSTKGMNGAQAMISLSKTDLFNLTAPNRT